MKKLLLIAGVIWLYIWWRKKKVKTDLVVATAPAAPAAPTGFGGGSATTAPASGPKTETHKSGIEVLRLHGNITDRGNIQRLTADILTADAQGLSIGDTINLAASNIYRGYYKIEDIVDGGNIQGIVLDTHYLGSEAGIYLSTEKTFVSGFHRQLNKRSAFR